MSQLINKTRQYLSDIDPLFFSLALALGFVTIYSSFHAYAYYYMDSYGLMPSMLFWGILLTRKHHHTTIRQLALGLAMVLWFVISQSVHYANDMGTQKPEAFFMVYLMAFPFAAVAQDGDRQLGTKLAGIAYVGTGLILSFCTVLLVLDALPGFLQPHVVWDGARLMPFCHPNICACIMMIAIAFCLYFFSLAEKRLHKYLLLAVIALFFYVIMLTNSRTGIMLSCCLLAGFFFFKIWRSGWKRFFLAAVVAVLVIVVLFMGLEKMFAVHSQQKVQALLSDQNTSADALIIDQETGGAKLNNYASQGTLLSDIGTLNSRTSIWRSTISAIADDPSVLLWGTDSLSPAVSAHMNYHVVHSHNSWLEVLTLFGLPGLFIALFFTAVAVWNIFSVLFFRNCTMEKKVLAMLLLALLAAGMMEPYLFTGTIYSDFAFFLCLGYLTQWKKHDP